MATAISQFDITLVFC